jgi:hypothetical protein
VSDVPPQPWEWRQVDPGELYEREHPEPGEDVVLDAYFRQRVGPKGWALLGADSLPVLIVDSGWGSPDVIGGIPGPVAELLARACDIPALEAHTARLGQTAHGAMRAADNLEQQLAEARELARAFYQRSRDPGHHHRGEPRTEEHLPDWLTGHDQPGPRR